MQIMVIVWAHRILAKRENIDGLPSGYPSACSYEMNLCVPLFLNLKSWFSVFPAPSLIIRFKIIKLVLLYKLIFLFVNSKYWFVDTRQCKTCILGNYKWGPQGVLGIWVEWLFIFSDLGSIGNYFRGAGEHAHSFGDLGSPAKKQKNKRKASILFDFLKISSVRPPL